MGEALIVRRGSKGSKINLTVVGGTSQPTDPKENTIWVDTSIAIGDFYLGAKEPTDPALGDVWVNTGVKYLYDGNPIELNSLEVISEPRLILSISAVSQYDGTDWIKPNSSTYVDSTWSDNFILVYDNGTFGIITPHYIERNVAASSSSPDYNYHEFTPSTTTPDITWDHVGMSSSSWYTYVLFGPIDLTNYTSVSISAYSQKLSGTTPSSIKVRAIITEALPEIGTRDDPADLLYQAAPDNTETTSEYIFDVSTLEGDHYIGVRTYYYSSGTWRGHLTGASVER